MDNNKDDFDLYDEAFNENLEDLKQKTREEILKEREDSKGGKFSSAETPILIESMPSSQETKNKAHAAEKAKKEREAEKLEKEVMDRITESGNLQILEEFHFGEGGRQSALEQRDVENAAKQQNENDTDIQSEITEDSLSDENQISDMNASFNLAHDRAEIDDHKTASLEDERENYKQELREYFNGQETAQDKSNDMDI